MFPCNVTPRPRTFGRTVASLFVAWLTMAQGRALADEPSQAAAPWRAKPAAPPLPVELTIVATSPDPPWLLRIENTGESSIRIPADVRLLTLELSTGKRAGTTKCSAPAALRPSQFPKSRELYLRPGDTYEEPFDPRLFCFGDAMDLLREGTRVKPRFGFGAFGAKGPFAAQGTDRPESFAPLRELVGKELTLPAVPPPAAPAPVSSGATSCPSAPRSAAGVASVSKVCALVNVACATCSSISA